MAFRFQRRIRIAPGQRLNVSKRGVGLSAGVPGASISLGRRGVYGNVGIPGTGLSYRTKLRKSASGSTGRRRKGRAQRSFHKNAHLSTSGIRPAQAGTATTVTQAVLACPVAAGRTSSGAGE